MHWLKPNVALSPLALAMRLRLPCLLLVPALAFPKQIWSFWDTEDLPRMAQLAVASWKYYAPDYEVKIMHFDTYKQFVQGEEHVTPKDLRHTYRFSDWLRTAVLARHGGVWLDATILLTAPLQHMVNESASFSGIHLEDRLEGFFLASVAGSELMKRWSDEILHISRLNKSDFDQYLTDLRARGIQPLNGAMNTCDWSFKSPLHSVAHLGLHSFAWIVNSLISATNFYLHICNERYWMDYLYPIVAFYNVLSQEPRSHWDLHITDSLRNFNFVSFSLGWNSSDIVHFMSTSRSQSFDLVGVRGIKLRKTERDMSESLKNCEQGSVICRLQRDTGMHVFAEVPALEAPDKSMEL